MEDRFSIPQGGDFLNRETFLKFLRFHRPTISCGLCIGGQLRFLVAAVRVLKGDRVVRGLHHSHAVQFMGDAGSANEAKGILGLSGRGVWPGHELRFRRHLRRRGRSGCR